MDDRLLGVRTTEMKRRASAGQLHHSRAVRAGWEDPLLAIKRRPYVDGRHFGCEEVNEAGIGMTGTTT